MYTCLGEAMPALAETPVVVEKPGNSAPFTPEEAKALFNETSLQYMGMSGEEFLSGWDNGQFRDHNTKSRAMRVAILIPLVRKMRARKVSR
jgi:hypothetical protein